jgi:hypothetical protein
MPVRARAGPGWLPAGRLAGPLGGRQLTRSIRLNQGVPIRTALCPVILLLAACSAQPSAAAPRAGQPPRQLLGRFQDDYGNHFRISDTEWVQPPHGRFHIVLGRPEEKYLVAQNDSANSYGPGKWTRIDWMAFEGMAPYTWGFCLTGYEAATAQAAAATAPPVRETPRTGCNGYPFSRMRADTTDQ